MWQILALKLYSDRMVKCRVKMAGRGRGKVQVPSGIEKTVKGCVTKWVGTRSDGE